MARSSLRRSGAGLRQILRTKKNVDWTVPAKKNVRRRPDETDRDEQADPSIPPAPPASRTFKSIPS
jgi:hypothetical protein